MSKKIPTLAGLIGAIHKHYGFTVHLLPVSEAVPTAVVTAPVKPVTTMADRLPEISDEAPYGRKADGTPKAKPGRKRGTKNAPKPAAAKPAAAAPKAAPSLSLDDLDLSDLGLSSAPAPAPKAEPAPQTAGDVLDALADELGLDAL